MKRFLKQNIPFVTAAAFSIVLFTLFFNTLPVIVYPPYHLYQDEHFLAADDLAGRGLDTPGIAKAEEYIAARFRDSGLSVMPGADGYFQKFTMMKSGFDKNNTHLTFPGVAPADTPLAGKDFRPFPWSDEGDVEGDLVFAGYGITAKKEGWDDYKNLNVKNKIVLILRGEPKSVFTGSSPTNYSHFKSKVRNAQQHGAKGLILVTLFFNDETIDNFSMHDRYYLAGSEWYREWKPYPGTGLPSVQLSVQASEQLFAVPGKTVEEIAAAIDRERTPASSFPLRVKSAHLSVNKYHPDQKITARNVIGFLPGNDPALKNEWVVVGAHHDHLGSFEGEGDTIYNGADDNASGTSAVLELAAYFSAHRSELKRSVLFITFSAEEWGLYGSEEFLRNDLPEGVSLAAMCNIDMIGRNPDKRLEAIRRKTTPYLSDIIDKAEKNTGITVIFYPQEKDYFSDDYNFSKAGVPTFFFSRGHTRTTTALTTNRTGLHIMQW